MNNEFAIKMAILDAKDAYAKMESCQKIIDGLFQRELQFGTSKGPQKANNGKDLYDIVEANRNRYLIRYNNLKNYIKSLSSGNEMEEEYLKTSLKVTYNKLALAQRRLESTEDPRLRGLITEDINGYGAEIQDLLSKHRDLNKEELITR